MAALANRQTELAAKHPIHVVCAWLGNSPAVAKNHYLQVRESDYQEAAGSGGASAEAAVQKAAQQAAAGPRTEQQTEFGNGQKPADLPLLAALCDAVRVREMTPTGSELPQKSPRKPRARKRGGANSGAPAAAAGRKSPLPPDLVPLLVAWDSLPAAVRAGIAGIVNGSRRSP